MSEIEGRAWIFGDHVNTDVIHPPEFFSLDNERVRSGLFNGLDPTFQSRLQPGDILVGGKNFGCGSSRETSIQSLMLNNIGAVIAISFGRIFYRNAINSGLHCYVLRKDRDHKRFVTGGVYRISLDYSVVEGPSGVEIELIPPGVFVKQILDAGGLLAALLDERG